MNFWFCSLCMMAACSFREWIRSWLTSWFFVVVTTFLRDHSVKTRLVISFYSWYTTTMTFKRIATCCFCWRTYHTLLHDILVLDVEFENIMCWSTWYRRCDWLLFEIHWIIQWNNLNHLDFWETNFLRWYKNDLNHYPERSKFRSKPTFGSPICPPQVSQQAARQVIGSLSRPNGDCGYGSSRHRESHRSNYGQSPYQQAATIQAPEELEVLAGIDVDEYFVEIITDHEERPEREELEVSDKIVGLWARWRFMAQLERGQRLGIANRNTNWAEDYARIDW